MFVVSLTRNIRIFLDTIISNFTSSNYLDDLLPQTDRSEAHFSTGKRDFPKKLNRIEDSWIIYMYTARWKGINRIRGEMEEYISSVNSSSRVEERYHEAWKVSSS